MKQPSFQQYQLQLAAHIRDPKRQVRPDGTRKHRVRVYNELVFNTLNSFLENAFPVLHGILPPKHWKKLVRRFLRDWRSPYPLFRDIPLALLEHLATVDLDAHGLPPFAAELAHYEWLELKVSVAPHTVRSARRLRLVPDRGVRINPTLELHAYRFAVHRVAPTWQPEAAESEPVFLAVWRDQKHQVRFMQLSVHGARLLHALQQGLTLEEARSGSGVSALMHVLETLGEWQEQDIVLGTRAGATPRPQG